MTIFNTSNLPQAPHFHLGPEKHEWEPTPSEMDDLSSSSGTQTGRRSLRHSLSKVNALTNRMNSMFFHKKRLSGDLSTSFRRNHSSMRLKRVGSSFSLNSSQSKRTAYRIAEQHRSLFFFSPRNPLRRILIRVTESPVFDFIIVVFIFLNCISLAMTNPSNSDTMTQVLDIVEWVFTGIFTLELVMKVIALGFAFHPGSYLRNPWNVLDIFIVSMSYLQILPGINNYSALRSLRALRPLRTIHGIPGLRIIVNSLLQSIPPFINVLVLLFFSFAIFGILGVQLWAGVLRNRCVITGSSYEDSNDVTLWELAYDEKGKEMLCSLFWLGRSCPSSYMGQSVHCQADGSPRNPNLGTISFDNIGWAFMQVFQIYAGEEWTLIMYQIQDAWSHLGVVYFLMVTFFGALFAVNLGLAVINDKFSHVSTQADGDTNSVSMKTKFFNMLQSRNESAWVLNKISWLDYHSDNESEGDLQSSGGEELSEISGVDSVLEDDFPRPLAVSLKRKSKLHMHMSHMSPKTNGATPADSSSSSSSDDNYESFVTPAVLPQITPAVEVDAAKVPSEHVKQQKSTDLKQKIVRRKSMKKRVLSFKRISSLSNMRTKPKGCCAGCLYIAFRTFHRIRRRVNHIVRNVWFTRIMLGAIALNTVFLSVEHYGQPDWLTITTEIANYVFIFIFTCELFLKLFGLGISFFKDWFNILDFLVVGASYLELIFADVSSLSVLRTFRLLRVFKLLSWSSLRKLTGIILKSFRSIFYLSIIFSLFVFIMTLIGMQSFAGRLDSMGPLKPVQNFDDFIHAAITVFQIVTKENWVYIYADLMEAQSGDTVQQLLTIFFMVITIILGDFILLNLFLAILLQSFDRDVDEVLTIKSSRSFDRLNNQQYVHDGRQPVRNDNFIDHDDDDSAKNSMNHPVPAIAIPQYPPKLRRRFSEFVIGRWREFKRRRATTSARDSPRAHLRSLTPEDEHSNPSVVDAMSVRSYDSRASSEAEPTPKKDPMPLRGRSLCIFPPTFKPRVIMKQIVVHPITEVFLLLCVVFSSLMLVVETPDLDPDSWLGQLIFGFGVFFATVFSVEMLIKFFVQGIVIFSFKKQNRVGYFNDPWNVLDALIVVVSIFTLAYTDARVSAVKALRALRPLRFVNRIRGLRIVVSTLFRSITAIINVLIICFLVFLIFGILGVQLFGGKFYYCSTEHIQSQNDCIFPGGVNRTLDFAWNNLTSTCSMRPEFEETIIYRSNCTSPMLWKNNQWHFDHLPSALLVLFEVGSVENWPDISNTAIAAVGIDRQPKKDYNIFAGLYFVLFVAVGAIFVVNLFVGVVLSSFNRIKEEEDGSLMLTEQQRDWVSTQRLFMKLKLTKQDIAPRNRISKLFFSLVTSTKFEYAVTAIIFINIIFMTLEYDGMSTIFSSVLTYANIVFTFIFTMEAALKLIGLGPLQYFTNGWNLFDFFVVILSIFGIVMSSVDAGIGLNPTILRVFRVFRIFRILRLIKTAKRIRTLLETLYYSVPSMFNVMLTVALACFVYAVMAMNLFYYVKPTKNSEMTHLANFQSFWNSMLTMIRISTSEDWNGIMRDCMNTENCVGNECGNPWLAVPFFVSYIIICTFVVMNLFVAVILDSFETQMRFEDSALNSSDLTRFVDIWSTFDPKATYSIPTEQLKNLLQRVGAPLGLPVDCSRAELIRKLVSLDIPEHQGRIHFIETLIPLARRVYGVDLPPHERRKLERNLAQRFKTLKKMSSTLGYTTGEYFAATYIQAAYRGQQVRKSKDAVIGLKLVRTDSGRLRFQIDRKAHRIAKMREREQLELEEKEKREMPQKKDSDSFESDISVDESDEMSLSSSVSTEEFAE
uniref:Uncharacterized protein n=1 Tax=Percolomonas cosmopolitus TaxID=63605 RepID=A0A7S1KN52_9EUKA|mmetsp:Transcript_1788/g.6334  ORF Transcript_1788/g.6334 Transcript_1788/m.6334 type:complete len:1834 (+) Transcript_1788:230-5731(+)